MARIANVPATAGLETEVVPAKELLTLTAQEYRDYSKSKGTYMGRKDGEKTKLTTEELRILINEGWTPDDVKEKHGIDDEELEQVVWKLSREERLDKPLRFGKRVKG